MKNDIQEHYDSIQIKKAMQDFFPAWLGNSGKRRVTDSGV